jgi:hypothetical protein
METGTHSIWVSEQTRELGHEVIGIHIPGLPGPFVIKETAYQKVLQ